MPLMGEGKYLEGRWELETLKQRGSTFRGKVGT